MTRVYFPSPYRGVWDGARVLGRTSLLATNLVWLLWAVWGGFFITKIILSNWLAITIKPVFDKPVDTAQVPIHRWSTHSNCYKLCKTYTIILSTILKIGGQSISVLWSTVTTTKCFRMSLTEASSPSCIQAMIIRSTECPRCPVLTQTFLIGQSFLHLGMSLLIWRSRIF